MTETQCCRGLAPTQECACEVRRLEAENQRLRVALQCAQKTFADIGNRDRVDEIEDALNPGWREKWA